MRLPPAAVGDPIHAIETPALLIDLDALHRNVARMSEQVATFPGVRLRPHAKTHKSPHVARLQLHGGAADGVCCQTIGEAEMLVRDAGAGDVLVTNQLVTPGKISRLVALARRADVAVCADDPANVAALATAAADAGVRLRVLVEVDVGGRRCGVAPGAPAAELARCIADRPSLRFGGIHAYHGSAQHLYGLPERQAAIAAAAGLAKESVEAIREIGLICDLVTGGGTGSWSIEAAGGVYNEVQPGSYVFMDADYARVAGPPAAFEHALFVLTTVVSRHADRAVCDAGLKAYSIDSGLPRVSSREDLTVAKASDEHGVLWAASGDAAALPRTGERVLLIPGHCDPTVNLYDHYACVRAGRVEDVWPIAARGA